MVSYMSYCFAAIAIMEVANPATNRGIDFFQYPLHWYHGSFSSRKLRHSVFDSLYGFL